MAAELIDQVRLTRQPEYVFHHPLIRAVAYESQLKSDRAELHRRVAAAIESRDPAAADENAALIAEHLEAAGDLHAAFGWHMRAGTWLNFRDITAARLSWQRARQVADRLPADRAGPCRDAYRAARPAVRDGLPRQPRRRAGFDELRELSTAADDKVSLAIGNGRACDGAGLHGAYRESSLLASSLVGLIESIGDPTLTVALLCTAAVSPSCRPARWPKSCGWRRRSSNWPTATRTRAT